MRIADEIKQQGYFWFMNNPENKYFGTLVIKDGGEINLELINSHIDESIFSSSIADDLDVCDRIGGYTERYSTVLLIDCQFTNSRLTTNVVKYNIYVKIAFLRHFNKISLKENNSKLLATKMFFSVEGLDDWLGSPGFELTSDTINQTSTLKYTKPNEIVSELDNGMTLSIYFTHSTSFPFVREAKMTNKAYFRISSPHEEELFSFMTIAKKIVELFSFFLEATVSLEYVSVHLSGMQVDYDYNEKEPPNVEMFYQSRPFSEQCPKISPFDKLISFKDIKDEFSSVINSWINIYDKFEPALNLYFAAREGAFTYLDSKFLAMSQCLESFCRRSDNKRVMDDESFAEITVSLMNACPEQHKEWLSNKLKYSNEISLNTRIKEMFEPFSKYLGGNKEIKGLSRRITVTRNYLTHYDESLRDEAVTDNRELLSLYFKMEAVFQLYLLRMLKLSDDEIATIVTSNSHIKSKLSFLGDGKFEL